MPHGRKRTLEDTRGELAVPQDEKLDESEGISAEDMNDLKLGPKEGKRMTRMMKRKERIKKRMEQMK